MSRIKAIAKRDKTSVKVARRHVRKAQIHSKSTDKFWKLNKKKYGYWSVSSKKRVIRRAKTTKALKRKSCKRK